MAQWISDLPLDYALIRFKQHHDYGYNFEICVCTQQPNSAAEARQTYNLAIAAVSLANSAPEADGSDGRKVVIPAVEDVPVTVTGTATHIALVWWKIEEGTWVYRDLFCVTTCAPLELLEGGLVSIPSWKVAIHYPT
jgi:hypothetical protein